MHWTLAFSKRASFKKNKLVKIGTDVNGTTYVLKLAIQILKIWGALEYKIVDLEPPNVHIHSSIQAYIVEILFFSF